MRHTWSTTATDVDPLILIINFYIPALTPGLH
jgi:hypothetical protein